MLCSSVLGSKIGKQSLRSVAVLCGAADGVQKQIKEISVHHLAVMDFAYNFTSQVVLMTVTPYHCLKREMEMRNFNLTAATVLSLALAMPAALAGEMVSSSKDFASFTDTYCGADRSTEHIFVLPLAALEDNGTVACDFGTSKIRVSEPETDPGHYIMNIDPPEGVADGLDCDGKADRGMTQIALN